MVKLKIQIPDSGLTSLKQASASRCRRKDSMLQSRLTLEADVNVISPGMRPDLRQLAAVHRQHCKEFIGFGGMTQVRTSPYYPQSNGRIEHLHKSLKEVHPEHHCRSKMRGVCYASIATTSA